MKKKTISLITVLCLVISLCAATAFAENEEEEVNAGFVFNDTWYWIGADNIPHTEEDGEDGTTALPDGVSYDYATNTLTLSGAKLTVLGINYSGYDEENNRWQNLPNPDLTIVLKGENSIINPSGGVYNEGNEYNAFWLTDGVNATILGDGSLTVIAEDAAEDEWVGRAISVGRSSLTVTGSAHVIAKVTGESCNVTEDDDWTDFIAIDGDWNTDCDLTVSENAVLEAYGDCRGIRYLDITAKDNAQIKTNMIDLSFNTPEQCEQNDEDPSVIEEGLAPRVMSVEDNAVVDIHTSYETEVEGCYEAMVLTDGSQLIVSGGTVNVVQDSGVDSWSNGDTGIGAYFDEELYDPEENADMRPAIVVSGGELNVDSSFVGIQMSGCDLTLLDGAVNLLCPNGRFALYGYNGCIVNLSGGSLTAETREYGYAGYLNDGELNVSGGNHRFGSKDCTSYAGLIGSANLSFTGGTTEFYGSYGSLIGSSYQQFFEDVENLDPNNLPIDEDLLACSIDVGDNMVVTDLSTGETLSTIGSCDMIYKYYEDETKSTLVGYEFDRDYAYTSDGSEKLELDEDGDFLNAATQISISEPAKVIPSFADVVPGAWYENAVNYVVGNNLMVGIGNDQFGPNEKLSRAQLAQVLYNKEGKPAVTSTNMFTDLASGAWYVDAVNWAASEKLVAGYGNGKFGPNDPITREQIAIILYHYADSPATTGTLDGFIDSSQASDYAVEALKWAVENGILSGKGNGILDPRGNATRAEVASMLMKYCENVEK